MNVDMHRAFMESAEDGFLPFVRFQQIALYHPILGYYMKARSPFGRTGDFYTAPGVHSLFGQTLGNYIVTILKEFNSKLSLRSAIETAGSAIETAIDSIHLIEFGAGDGRLAHSILKRLQQSGGQKYDNLYYHIVEVSARSREEQEQRLSGFPNVIWESDLPALDFAVIVSNELVDAMPVHWVQRETVDKWSEVGLKWGRKTWKEHRQPITDPTILQYLERYGRELPIGHRMEVNLQALDWMEHIAEQISHGYLITFDYGAELPELYPDYQRTGTLRGFQQHQVHSDVFSNPGEMDMTHDVNFTALIEKGNELGFETVCFTSQSDFLVKCGLLELAADLEKQDPSAGQAVKHLLLGFSPKFHALVQRW